MPDFDIDFCQDRRDEVIRYVQTRYGRDRVAQIITFGTLQARGVLRDVGRVLQMPYGQVDKLCKLVPQNALNPVTLGRPSTTSRACRRSATAIRWSARLRHRAEARRAAPPRLDACGRHRDRRAAARRARAALSRSEIADAGHPVQHEMGRAGGPGEVRLPRPQDPHGARDRGESPAPARRRDRSGGDPARRRQDLRACLPAPKRSASSRWKVRACAARCSTCGRPLRGHHRAGRALPAGADGQYPDLLRPQARRGGARLHPPEARADPARDLRRHRLSGTGDAGRAGAVAATRSAKRICCAARWARRSAAR